MKIRTFFVWLAWLSSGTMFMILLAFFRIFQNINLQVASMIPVSIIIGLLFIWKKPTYELVTIFTIPFIYEYLYFFYKKNFDSINLFEIFIIILSVLIVTNFKKFSHFNRVSLPVLFLASVYIYLFYFIPIEDYKSFNKVLNNQNKKIDIDSIFLYDLDSNKVSYSLLIQNKIAVIDFSFIGCMPCKLKYNPLVNLANKNRSDNGLTFFRIINGKLDNFKDFQEYYKPKFYLNSDLPIYYDIDGKMNKLFNIQAYPTEMIFDKKQEIKYILNGFSASITSSLYFEQTQTKINSLK